MTAAVESPLLAGSTVALRPMYEGANIATWIGFKHVNYLVEAAVLGYLRRAGFPAGLLYERHALGTELVALDTRIATAIHIDDETWADVRPAGGTGLELIVRLSVERDGARVRVATSRVRVLFRRAAAADAEPVAALAPYVVDRLDVPHAGVLALPPGRVPPVSVRDGGRGRVPDGLLEEGNGLAWRWRVPYFYCHFSERLQMSGCLRLLEEGVDLFLAQRGVSIRTMLAERDWIPVVPRSSLRLVAEVPMEEELVLRFSVTEVVKNLTYTAELVGFRRDGDTLRPAFVGSITHAYAHIDSRRDWRLVPFDDRLLAALRGEG